MKEGRESYHPWQACGYKLKLKLGVKKQQFLLVRKFQTFVF